MKIRIYKMFLKGDEPNCYVGSTKNSLNERVYSRRGYIRQRIKNNKCLDKVSTHFKDNLYDICISLVYECDCETKEEQFKLESEYIKLLKPSLNQYRPYVSSEEEKKYKKDYNIDYRQKNKEKLRAYDSERNKDRNSYRNKRRTEKITCKYCDKQISRGGISTHIHSCKSNPKNFIN